MNTKIISFLLVSVLFTGIGLVCGWLSFSNGGAVATQGGHSRGSGGGHSHGGGGHSHGGGETHSHDGEMPVLSPQALNNIGVKAEPATLGSFTRYQPVAAVVSATPNYYQELFAPVAGRVKSVEARFGAFVQSNDLLVTLIRDPIPWVMLTLTGEVLKPVSEHLHDLMANYERATLSVEILEKELNRLKSFSDEDEALPLLPTEQIIKVEYDLLSAERELSIVRHELIRHGLSEETIARIEEGEVPPVDAAIWLGALKNNGYWTPLAQEIYTSLPGEMQNSSWAVATIAELVAGDLVDASLKDWLQSDPDTTNYFLEIGGLLQRSYHLEYIKELFALGAMEPIVQIRSPSSTSAWDVRDIKVKPGQYVEARESLLVLEDPHCLYLRAGPTDSEIGSLVKAMEADARMEARPLIRGAGPLLEDLQIQKIFSDDDGHASALLPLENRPIFKEESTEGAVYRTWQLRYGQRYEIRVPLEIYNNVYVLPTGSVVDDGVDKIVFLQSGEEFTKIPVEVLYQDHEVALLPASSNFFPGNPIVTHGAFALSLAMQTGADAGHAGHGHTH